MLVTLTLLFDCQILVLKYRIGASIFGPHQQIPLICMPTYSEVFAAQEQIESMPNEVAGIIANLLGLGHYEVHRMLLAANPVLAMCGTEFLFPVKERGRLAGLARFEAVNSGL
jgi:hypothetical protein